MNLLGDVIVKKEEPVTSLAHAFLPFSVVLVMRQDSSFAPMIDSPAILLIAASCVSPPNAVDKDLLRVPSLVCAILCL